MKTSKLPRQLSKNASKYHKKVGELLTSPMFSGYKIRQEYPVKKVNPEFKSGREKFDWAILDLKVVIEVHGQQHSVPCQFGGIDKEQALRNLRDVQARDKAKEQAALQANWGYVVLKYDSVESFEPADLLFLVIGSLCQVGCQGFVFKKQVDVRGPKKKYNWPVGKKIQSRPFPKKVKNDR